MIKKNVDARRKKTNKFYKKSSHNIGCNPFCMQLHERKRISLKNYYIS